jgi:translation elongation factor EF-1beta/ribosomal protein L12E/L44/L45/RPP1/RPP2
VFLFRAVRGAHYFSFKFSIEPRRVCSRFHFGRALISRSGARRNRKGFESHESSRYTVSASDRHRPSDRRIVPPSFIIIVALRPHTSNHYPNNKYTMASLPAYDLSVDELRVALTYANSDVVITKVAYVAPTKAAAAPAAAAPAAKADDDDFDVFADDDEEDDEPKESRADMLARLKKEAEVRTAKKEANQRTLVAIEIKPWDVEQDLMALFRKITKSINQDGLKWAENCNLVDVAYGIQKIQTTFVMGATNSSDDVVEKILEMEDEVQSCEVITMNVL